MIKLGDGSRTPTIIERDHLFPIEDNLLRSLISSPLARIMRCGRFCIHDGGFQAQTALVTPAGGTSAPIKYRENAPIKSTDRSHSKRILHQRLFMIVGAEASSCTAITELSRRGHAAGSLSVDVAVDPLVDQVTVQSRRRPSSTRPACRNCPLSGRTVGVSTGVTILNIADRSIGVGHRPAPTFRPPG